MRIAYDILRRQAPGCRRLDRSGCVRWPHHFGIVTVEDVHIWQVGSGKSAPGISCGASAAQSPDLYGHCGALRGRHPGRALPAPRLSLLRDHSGAGAGGSSRPCALHDYKLRRRADPGHQPTGDDAGGAVAAHRQVRPVRKVAQTYVQRRHRRANAQGHQARHCQRRHFGPKQRTPCERYDRLQDFVRCPAAGRRAECRE